MMQIEHYRIYENDLLSRCLIKYIEVQEMSVFCSIADYDSNKTKKINLRRKLHFKEK